MICSNCGKQYDYGANNCPYCGVAVVHDDCRKSAVSDFLNGVVKIGSVSITRLNIIFLIIINIAVISFAINGIAYYMFGFDAIWFQYVLCGSFSAYIALKGVLAGRNKILRHVRRAVYLTMLILTVVAIIFDGRYNPLVFVNSSFLITVSVVSFVCLLFKGCSYASFGFTALMNMVISIIPLVFMGYMKETPDPLGVLMSYAAFAVSALTVVNFVLLWILSISRRVKSCF